MHLFIGHSCNFKQVKGFYDFSIFKEDFVLCINIRIKKMKMEKKEKGKYKKC